MRKIRQAIALFAIVLVVFSFSAAISFAHEDEEELALGKQLVDSKVSCSDLDDENLEAIGEYIMEQMHPGESHDLMHQMMGVEEDTKEHEQLHVKIAKHHYCNDYNTTSGFGMKGGCGMMRNKSMVSGSGMMGSGGMMGNMMNMMSGGMMGSGMMSGRNMMGNDYQNLGGNKMAYGMMGGYGGTGMMGYGSGMMSSGMFWLNGFLAFLLLIGLVVLVWLWVFKSWNDLTKKNKK